MADKSPQRIAEETIGEVWAVHAFLAKVGFDFDEIYVGKVVDINGDSGVGVILRSQGKQAAFAVGKPGVEFDEWAKMWMEHIRRHNAREISAEENRAIVEGSWIRNHYIDAMRVLVQKGFKLDLTDGFEETSLSFDEKNVPIAHWSSDGISTPEA